MADEKLEVVITADDRASGVFGGLQGALGGLSKILMTGVAAAAVVAGTAIYGLGNFLGDSVSSAIEAENAMTQLNAVIKSTEGVAGVTSEAAVELANSLQKVTKFSDEAILGGENLLLTFTNIGKDIFPDATKIMLDMSTALGQDLRSSAIQLGKALQDPVLGITALRRVGVNFNEESKDLIKTMVEQGDIMGAQKYIMQELQKEFGGSAEAAGKTFAGSLEILKNQFDDIKEGVGAKVIPILQMLMEKIIIPLVPWIELAAERLGDFLTKFANSEQFQNFIANLGQELPKLIDTLSNFLTGEGNLDIAGWLMGILGSIDWIGIGSLIVSGLGSALINGISGFVDGIDWDGMVSSIQENIAGIDWAGIAEAMKTAVKTAISDVGLFLDSIDWEKASQDLAAGIDSIDWNSVGSMISTLISGAIDLSNLFFEKLAEAIVSIDWATLGISLGNALFNFILGLFHTNEEQFASDMKNFWFDIGEQIKNHIQSVVQTALNSLFQLTTGFYGIGDAVIWVADQIMSLSDALSNLTIPDWLTPGSPTPFETGLLGISDALAEVGSTPFPSFPSQSPLGSNGASGGRPGASGSPIVLNFTYAPEVSFGSEREMRDRIAPVLTDLLRQAQNNGVI